MTNLLAKIIRENLTLSLYEIGTARTIDLIADICENIANNGGGDVKASGAFFEKDEWAADCQKLKQIIDHLST
jgi:hypothetical protein